MKHDPTGRENRPMRQRFAQWCTTHHEYEVNDDKICVVITYTRNKSSVSFSHESSVRTSVDVASGQGCKRSRKQDHSRTLSID